MSYWTISGYTIVFLDLIMTIQNSSRFKAGDVISHNGWVFFVLDNYTLFNGEALYRLIDLGNTQQVHAMHVSVVDKISQLHEATFEQKKQIVAYLQEPHKNQPNLFYQFQQECDHSIINSHEVAVCEICQKRFSWYCPDSPDHLCYYFVEKGNVVTLSNGEVISAPSTHDSEYESYDWCMFCGDPEERK